MIYKIPASLSLFIVSVLVCSYASATGYRKLYDLATAQAQNPTSTLVIDSSGNVYGTTALGGADGDGIAFQLTPGAGRSWAESTIHDFGLDGIYPSQLSLDRNGNLYGTTQEGSTMGGGSVFELAPPPTPGDPWNETILYSFTVNSYDAYFPQGPLTLDGSGNLYGTTFAGGAYGGGTVFKLTHAPDGSWTESVIYSFCGVGTNCEDGYESNGGLLLDSMGNLFGVTRYGGANFRGAVFELAPNPDGTWTESVLYSFCPGNGKCVDGRSPTGKLALDAAGNLYGTTELGGVRGRGTAFKLINNGGTWSETVLWSFGYLSGAAQPENGLILDVSSGNLYGSSYYGGKNDDGTVFELSPTSKSTWMEQDLYRFHGTDGARPNGVVMDPRGNLYGTTLFGGLDYAGTVYMLIGSGGNVK